MFIDASSLAADHLLETDICIIGAGAAGITIAREFLGSSREVVLLESGGLEYDEKTQSLYKGKNTGLPSFDLHINRLRFFGGTTNHWFGHCRPLDAIDFEQRDWLPHSGWPIRRHDLDPYYERAQAVCGLGEYRYEELDYFLQKIPSPALDLDEQRLKSAVYNQSPPTRFGKVYRQELEQATNITVYLNANVLELETNESASQIVSARLTTIGGRQFSVRANRYILATGGMENARILLLSNKTATAGLGNDKDIVGRYFMDHVLLRPGLDVSFTRRDLSLKLYHQLHQVAGGRMFAVLAATEKLQRSENITNFRVHLVRAGPKYEQPMGSVFSDLDQHPQANPPRKDKHNSIAMHLVLEPVPNPASRITLADKRDFLGQRKIDVTWLLTAAELKNARRAMELVALEFGRMGLGRAYGEIFKNQDRWPANLEAGKHHCGTTRMAAGPETGVVDHNCKVFGVANLFIAGSSVFPTIGYANPTLTIVALALRLADHLKRQG